MVPKLSQEVKPILAWKGIQWFFLLPRSQMSNRQKGHTPQRWRTECKTLRTVPVFLKNGNRRIIIIDWEKHAEKWDHLKGIQFPNSGIRPIVDLLIGVDYAELHYSIKDVRGQSGEPVARRTPISRAVTFRQASHIPTL